MQAETYHNHATSLIHSTSNCKTLLAYKLCQARISDYVRKFLEAASRYHKLSFVGKIDENERTLMLYIYTTYFVLCIIKSSAAGQWRSPVLYLHQLAQTTPGSYPPYVMMSIQPSSPLIASL